MISSDEESVELELIVTPSAPLTPGAQLELDLEDWLESRCGDQMEQNFTASLQESSDVDSMVELQPCEHSDSELILPIGLEGNCFRVFCIFSSKVVVIFPRFCFSQALMSRSFFD